MTYIEYTLIELEYIKLMQVLPKLSKRGNMIKTARSSKEAAFLVDRTGVLFHYYDGTATLGGRRIGEIRQTESLLERVAGIKLIPKQNGRRK